MDNTQIRSLFSIWIKPRETMRKLLDTHSTSFIIFLAMIGGISNTLDRASTRGTGDDMPIATIIILALTLGAIGGILTLYIASALIKWTVSWIGGKGTFAEIKTAYAWSNVTAIATLILWIPLGLLYGPEMFYSEMPILATSQIHRVFLFVFIVIEIVIIAWTVLILVKSVAEAQRFSAWKGLANLVLSVLAVLVPLLLIGTVLFVVIN